VAYTLEHYKMKDSGNFVYPEDHYRKLGYTISGNQVSRHTQEWKQPWNS